MQRIIGFSIFFRFQNRRMKWKKENRSDDKSTFKSDGVSGCEAASPSTEPE